METSGSSSSSRRGSTASACEISSFCRVPGRVILDQLRAVFLELEILEEKIDLFLSFGIGDLVEVLVKIEVLLAGQFVVEERLVGDVGDQLFQLVMLAVVGLAVDDDAAAVGGQQPGQDLQRGGLARPVRPQQAVDLPGGQGKSDALQGLAACRTSSANRLLPA